MQNIRIQLSSLCGFIWTMWVCIVKGCIHMAPSNYDFLIFCLSSIFEIVYFSFMFLWIYCQVEKIVFYIFSCNEQSCRQLKRNASLKFRHISANHSCESEMIPSILIMSDLFMDLLIWICVLVSSHRNASLPQRDSFQWYFQK